MLRGWENEEGINEILGYDIAADEQRDIHRGQCTLKAWLYGPTLLIVPRDHTFRLSYASEH
jgi:hypothetical protein